MPYSARAVHTVYFVSLLPDTSESKRSWHNVDSMLHIELILLRSRFVWCSRWLWINYILKSAYNQHSPFRDISLGVVILTYIPQYQFDSCLIFHPNPTNTQFSRVSLDDYVKKRLQKVFGWGFPYCIQMLPWLHKHDRPYPASSLNALFLTALKLWRKQHLN